MDCGVTRIRELCFKTGFQSSISMTTARWTSRPTQCTTLFLLRFYLQEGHTATCGTASARWWNPLRCHFLQHVVCPSKRNNNASWLGPRISCSNLKATYVTLFFWNVLAHSLPSHSHCLSNSPTSFGDHPGRFIARTFFSLLSLSPALLSLGKTHIVTGAAWPIYISSSVTSPPPLGGQCRHPPTAVGWHLSQTAARLPSLVLSSLLHLVILDGRLRLLSWSVHRIPHCRWPDRSTWF